MIVCQQQPPAHFDDRGGRAEEGVFDLRRRVQHPWRGERDHDAKHEYQEGEIVAAVAEEGFLYEPQEAAEEEKGKTENNDDLRRYKK